MFRVAWDQRALQAENLMMTLEQDMKLIEKQMVVPRRRLELPRPCGHWHLKPARLPIPPPGQIRYGNQYHPVHLAGKQIFEGQATLPPLTNAIRIQANPLSKRKNMKSQNRDKLVTVFGGSGFVGTQVVRALAKKGYRIRVAVRRPDLAGHLQPLGSVGQIHAVQANLRYRDSVDRAAEGSWGVINCVGILFQSGKQRFDAVHDEGARAVAWAARGAGAARMVHLSTVGADAESLSAYGRSKAAGEAAIHDGFPDGVILRPSVIFGPGDNFMNKFASLARIMPILPVVSPQTRFQPVFVGDVAKACVNTLESGSGIYELGGPEIRTMMELMEQMLRVIERQRVLLPVPYIFARTGAVLAQLLPNPLLTVDQLLMLGYDNIVSQSAESANHTLQGLDILPTAHGRHFADLSGTFPAHRSVSYRSKLLAVAISHSISAIKQRPERRCRK